MKLLPPSTRPPTQKIRRLHSPTPARGRYGYQGYRACLRWEFGFSCAFCLLHETDLAHQGVEGLGVTGIEHFYPASTHPQLVNDYDNCFYVCRMCNDARASAAVASGTRRLLNPCNATWSAHFEHEEDRVKPRSGDFDAEYTHESYDLDDPRKVRMRRMRRETIQECMALIEKAYDTIDALIERGIQHRDSLSLEAAQELRQCVLLAEKDIARYRAVSMDAPGECRCDGEIGLTLPEWLDTQALRIFEEFEES